jgi:transposase
LDCQKRGAQWRELPFCYEPWQSAYSRFAKWRDDGILEKVFRTLSSDADMENISIDSTCVKVQTVGKKRLIRLLGIPKAV